MSLSNLSPRNDLFLSLLLFLALINACSRTTRHDSHYDRARELLYEMEIESETEDYTRPEYAEIIEELEKISPRYARYEEGMKLLEEIRSKRHHALSEKAKKAIEEERDKKQEKRRMEDLINSLEEKGAERSASPGEKEVFLLELKRTRESRSGGEIIVDGEVQNISRERLSNVMVIVEFFDADGAITDSAKTLLKKSSLKPGDRTTFSASIKYTPRMERYRIRFREALTERIIPAKRTP